MAKCLDDGSVGIHMRKAILLSALMFCVIFSPISSALDGDGDGVDDSIDICPFAAGTANSTAGIGCPDSNGDGLADFEQTVMHNWDNTIRENTDQGSVGSGVRGIAWALNDSWFYAGGGNNGVHLFDSLGRYQYHMHQMPGDINEISVSPDGTMLAVVSDDGGCRVIDSTTGNLVVDLLNNSSSDILSIAWSNDGSRLITHGGGSQVSWFETSNWTLEQNITSLPGYVGGIDTTPDDRLVLFSTDNNLRGYWLSNGTIALNMTNHTQYIRALTISPDGRYVATGSNDNNIVITDISTQTVVVTIQAGSDVYDLEFSPDGGTLVAARGRQSSMYAYRTDSWTSLGQMEDFGSSNQNRGVYSISFDSEGERLAVGWRRGYTSLHMVPDAYISVHGDYYTTLQESSWRSNYLTSFESVRVWDGERVMTTIDSCDSKQYIGSSTNGVSPLYATKTANYSTTGLWDCKNTDGQILEVPYGRTPGALMVKGGGATETCLQTIGGLSMGQVRWMTSGANKNSLIVDGDMPGLVWSSVIPNDDNDGKVEWKDLDSTCPDTEIVFSHRWDNRTDTTILEETVLCSNCAQTDSMYLSSGSRYRASDNEFRSDILGGVSGPSGEGSIGFTELVYSIDNANGVYLIPLVDNYTHGIVDAVADGGLIVNASLNNSRSGEWPLQTDMRAFMSTESLPKNLNFLKYLLTDIGQQEWELAGFVGLGPWDLYSSWAKLGVNMIHLLPDSDEDGIWDDDDICPNTELGLSTDQNGCADNQLDDDNDGYTNDLDDCDEIPGTSTFDSLGCLDGDGDGWSDASDSHPEDISEWNDTDVDGFGDNSDDCIDVLGNSTEDVLGCIDSDGDGWSDVGDVFPEDPVDWADADSDGYGDNTDLFPYENTQWEDFDSDGFGDNNTGLEGDDCVEVSGSSHKGGLFGCIDSDNDGWADSIDDLPNDPEQHTDIDGDGIGDDASMSEYDWCPETPISEIGMVDSNGCSPSERDSDYDTFKDDVDQCLNTPLLQSTQVNTTLYLDANQTILNPFVGCALSEIDADGDLVYADRDLWDDNPDQSEDWDGDGFGDNSDGLNGDDCPNEKGYSFNDKIGCRDLDGDGWSYDSDFNDGDITQWNDTDGDGFGDNWDDPDWSESRTFGEFVKNATEPDRCPEIYSAFVYSETQGCLTALDDGKGDDSSGNGDESGDSNTLMILAIAGAGVIFLLFGAIAVILKKKPTPKNKMKRNVARPSIEGGIEDAAKDVLESIEVEKPLDFVATWEELPEGEWLPNDENGVNWYRESNGQHWYSDSGGFRTWDK
jgi:WD40 repeat protein